MEKALLVFRKKQLGIIIKTINKKGSRLNIVFGRKQMLMLYVMLYLNEYLTAS